MKDGVITGGKGCGRTDFSLCQAHISWYYSALGTVMIGLRMCLRLCMVGGLREVRGQQRFYPDCTGNLSQW